MTRDEIKREIEKRLGPIISESLQNQQDPEEAGRWYRAVCKTVVNGVAQRQAVNYYVFNEGRDDEEAFYQDKIPEPVIPFDRTTTAWRDAAQTEIDKKIAIGAVEKAKIISVDEQNEFAVAEVYLLENEILVHRNYLVYKDKDGLTRFNPITEG